MALNLQTSAPIGTASTACTLLQAVTDFRGIMLHHGGMPDPRALLAELGREVRALRRGRGWSRRQLAEHAAISERFLADVEAGRANPSIAKLLDLATALGSSPAELLRAADRHRPAAGQRIALLGLRGAGKSSVGRALAAILDWPFVELDAEIERHSGLTLEQIFELNGTEAFRRAERETLRGLLDSGPRQCVLATGGGLVTDPETWTLLRGQAWTVWLKARPEEHWHRVVAQGDTRPMAGHDAAFDALTRILREREREYRRARFTVDTTERSPDEVAAELARRWRTSKW